MADSANKGRRPQGKKLAQAAGRGSGRKPAPRSARTPGGARKPRGVAGPSSSARAAGPVTAAGGGGGRPPSSRGPGRGTGGSKRPRDRRPATKDAAAGKRRRFFNYPRAGKGPIMRWLPGWRFLLGTFLLMVIAVVGAFVVAYQMVKVPEPSEFAQAQTTTVYYADGTTKMGEFAEVDRTIVDTSTLPAYVGKAVVASEDRTFYSNKGVDPKGIIRAFVNNLRGGATQGASTLTQQYVKNYYVDTTSSYGGKFEQAIMAIKIDREMNKDRILDSYLNTVYYGRGAYGIEAASQAFFGHPASEMTVSEAALVAGILPAPSSWDPAISPEQAKERWQRVLDYMYEDGYISQQQYAGAVYPETITSENTQTYAGPNGYLLQMVREELENNAGLTPEQIDTGGFTIVTTVDKKDQDAAVTAVQNLPEGHSDNLQVALVSIDPNTGGVLALYGGTDYLTSQVNASIDARAQAGSTFKPFALIAGLEAGLTLSNGYQAYSPMDIEGTSFQNFQNAQFPWVDLVGATTDSVNTAYLQLNRDVGPEATNEVAIRAGYPEDTYGMNEYVQNVLGSASPHTLDIATAFSTIADRGMKHETHIVGSVTNPAGAVSYKPSTDGEKVFSEGVMDDATYAMEQVVNSGSGETAKALGRPVAAKTGSSSDNKSAQFVGYTPQITTAVTLYQSGPNGEEESITPWGDYEEITGSTYPADIFTEYMTTALQDLPVENFPDRTPGSYDRGSLHGTAMPVAGDNAPTPEPTAPANPLPSLEPEPGDQNSSGNEQPEPGRGSSSGGQSGIGDEPTSGGGSTSGGTGGGIGGGTGGGGGNKLDPSGQPEPDQQGQQGQQQRQQQGQQRQPARQ